MRTYTQSGQPRGNLWGEVKQFSARGGFQNGLNPVLVGRTWFVNTNSVTDAAELRGPIGSDSNDGLSPLTPFATVARAFEFVGSYDVIVISGVVREQVVAPLEVYDVTLIGSANRPRQATSGGVATGGGASWLAPASGAVASTPLLELVAAGWSISNIEFTPHTGSAAIRLTRSATVDTTDASHFSIIGCFFGANGVATPIGIEDNGGCSRGLIQDCRFESLTTAIKGLNTAAAIPSGWRITGNRFIGNTNAIGMSLTEGLVDNNFFRQAANDTNFKVNLVAVAAQGSLNQVYNNLFSDVAANVTIAKGYKPGTTDVWRNFVTDVAAYIVTVPS
jgi:hypothetical protein